MPPLFFKQGMAGKLRWFDDEPNPGEPECICSLCGDRIDAGDEIDRIISTESLTHHEARLHRLCSLAVIDWERMARSVRTPPLTPPQNQRAILERGTE